jgi:hypothetical protein
VQKRAGQRAAKKKSEENRAASGGIHVKEEKGEKRAAGCVCLWAAEKEERSERWEVGGVRRKREASGGRRVCVCVCMCVCDCYLLAASKRSARISAFALVT